MRSGSSISACSKPAEIAFVIIVESSIVLLVIFIRRCDGSVREEKRRKFTQKNPMYSIYRCVVGVNAAGLAEETLELRPDYHLG